MYIYIYIYCNAFPFFGVCIGFNSWGSKPLSRKSRSTGLISHVLRFALVLPLSYCEHRCSGTGSLFLMFAVVIDSTHYGDDDYYHLY